MSYLEDLNIAQRAAVEQIDGPMMVVPGRIWQNKGTNLCIAHLINQGVDSFNILALTFTNKAAKEMKNSKQHHWRTDAHNLWMGTFHSVFAKFYVMKPNTSISPQTYYYDTSDAKKPYKKHYKEQNLDKDVYKPNVVYSR